LSGGDVVSSWRQVLDQHVSFFEELGQHLLRLLMLDIERQTLLRAVAPHEVRCHATYALVIRTREVAAAGPLDLDDAGAKVGELTRAGRRSDGVFQRNDSNSIQRPHE